MFSLSACSRVKSTKKELGGQWEVVSYKYTNSNGLSYYYTAINSNVYFDNCSDDKCPYGIEIVYDNQGIYDTMKVAGTYQFLDKKAEYYDLTVDGGTPSDTISSARILLITKDDLLTEYIYKNAMHTLVLKKVS